MARDIHAYIINMDSAVERWKDVEANFAATRVPFTRIPGVDGRRLQLPVAEFSSTRYSIYHGRRTNPCEIGCYLSHIKCLNTFLASPHEYAVICEDDIRAQTDLRPLLEAAIDLAPTWDILRLSGYHNPHPAPYAQLPGEHKLCVTFTRLSGSGAYMIDRRVANVLLEKLLPMRVPYDHALDREWFYGLRAASLIPLPVDQRQHTFDSQIELLSNYKLPWYRRLTVFPYQAFNEITRVLNRIGQWQRAKRFVRHQTIFAGYRRTNVGSQSPESGAGVRRAA